MQKLKALLALAFALVVTNLSAAVTTDMAWTHASTLVVNEPYVQDFSPYPPTVYHFMRKIYTIRESSASVLFPSVPNFKDNLEEYFYYVDQGSWLQMYRYSHIRYNYANYLHQGPVPYATDTNLPDGAVVMGSGTSGLSIATQIHDSPLRQAHSLFGWYNPAFQPGTSQTYDHNGRQFIRVNGPANTQYYLKVHLGTGTEMVTGFHYVAHFFRINTQSGNQGTGITSPPFSDVDNNATVNVNANVWYDVTPSFVSVPQYYDFSYQITIVSVTLTH